MKFNNIDQAFNAESLYGSRVEPTYSGALSFMRRKYTRDLAGVDVAVTGVPLDTATTNRPGARFGPAAVRAASAQLAWGPPWPWGFDPFDRLAVVDYGDCYFDHGRPDETSGAIEAHATAIIQQEVSLLTLGGDHFISLPLLRAHAKKYGALSLIHFDAHSDTWKDEDGRVDHGTMFFHAAKEGIVDPSRSVQVGIRTHNSDTIGFTTLDAAWVHENGVETAVSEIKRVVGGHKAYLTFDIDCLDPSFAPGTGTPVVGGLSTYQAQSMIRALGDIDLVAMDMVEVAPAYDNGAITALAAASLIVDYLCVLAQKLPVRERSSTS
ncbi:MAG: agmatinase [Gammaproteobacteria bacterium]|nr:agmatinase [Gammaproteobacteria bacterium]